MIVVGIDTSLTSTGIAVVDDGRIILLDSVKSTGKAGDSVITKTHRIQSCADRVLAIVNRYSPQLIVIEGPSFNSRFGAPHDRAGLWWGIVIPLILDGKNVAVAPPTCRAKYGTGKGNAKKVDVTAAVRGTYQGLTTERIANDDEGDALILAAMGARRLGMPVVGESLTDAQLDGLRAVSWPLNV